MAHEETLAGTWLDFELILLLLGEYILDSILLHKSSLTNYEYLLFILL